jgi:hypothetical protein
MAKHIDILKFDWAGAARDAGKKVDAGYAATGRKPFGIKDLEANPSLRLARSVSEMRQFGSDEQPATAAASKSKANAKAVKATSRTGLSHGR